MRTVVRLLGEIVVDLNELIVAMLLTGSEMCGIETLLLHSNPPRPVCSCAWQIAEWRFAGDDPACPRVAMLRATEPDAD